MDKNLSKKSLETKKLNNKSFQLPIEESIKIIDEVRKIQKHSKLIKPEENRKQYQELLQWVLEKLQASKQSVLSKKSHFDEQNIEILNIQREILQEEVQIQQRSIIQSLMQEMIQMFKRECKQKSQLMQVCFSYFNQLIDSYTKYYEKEFYETFKTYNAAITEMEDQYEDKISDYNKKISTLESEKESKWKNLYMLAKDNRVLRRQKGKLLRNAQEQAEKIRLLEEEFCQVQKENEMNKLIIRFENDPKNLEMYLKNRAEILKFEKTLQIHPKRAMKVLNNELLKLQIEQMNSLDSKIDYIRRVIAQHGEIIDQYEDLNEMAQKPNKLVFNMYSQTDPDDIQKIQTKDASVNTNIHSFTKKLKKHYQVFQLKIETSSPHIQQTKHSPETDQVLKRDILRRFSNINIKQKDTFRLRFCPQVFNEFVRLRIKRKSDLFDIFHSTEISQTPKFKDKFDFIKNQTTQNGVKKQSVSKFSPNRKSQTLINTNYTIKNLVLNKIDDLSCEKSQITSKNTEQVLQKDNNTLEKDAKQQTMFKLKKNTKRTSRRITENFPLPTFYTDLTQNSVDQQKKSQNSLQEVKQKIPQENVVKLDSSTKKDNPNGSNSKNTKRKSNETMKKMSRVQTTSNLRIKNSPRLLTEMDFIKEQSSEKEIQSSSVNSKSNLRNRYSHNPTSSQQKIAEFNVQKKALIQLKQCSVNELIKGNKKYRINIHPTELIQRGNPASFSTLKDKVERRNNADIISMHSFASNHMIEVKPKQLVSFEGLQSQFFDPISIKPYQVKKIAEKILRNMYTRRKELISATSSPCLKNFIEHFMKQLYGEKWKTQKNLLRYIFTVHDRESSSDVRVFNLLMNTNVHVEYLQDLFRLYLIMMDKHEFSGIENYLICSKNKGISILKYLLSIYFDEQTSNEILQNIPIFNHFEIDLNEIFIVVETQMRKYTLQTEIYQFLSNLIPENQSSIEFSHMKEIIFLFKNQPNYHTHIARLKYFFKIHGKVLSNQQHNSPNKIQNSKGIKSPKLQKVTVVNKASDKDECTPQIQILPLHKVCLYLKRYEWTNILEIKTFVEDKYNKIVGVYNQDETIKYISKYCLKRGENSDKKKRNLKNGVMNISTSLQKKVQTQNYFPLLWLLERTMELIKNFQRYRTTLDKHFLMFVHLSILTYELQIVMQEVISEPLNFFTNEFKRIKTKSEMDAFLKD